MSESATPPAKLPALSVVVLNEDAAAAEHAVTLLRIVETMFLEMAEVCVKRWSFHQLERLDVRAMAGHHGKDAVILMVCSSTSQSIPDAVASWMRRTYQSAHCLKPLIIRYHQGSVLEEDLTRRLASTWKVPLACDFSLDATACWEDLRDFVEERLRVMQDSGEDDSEAEFARHSPARPPTRTESAPIDQAIRDHAYQLWVAAGRPDGRNLEFWHQAERDMQTAKAAVKRPEPYEENQPKTITHDNTTAHSGLRRQPAPEFMLRIPNDRHARPSNALLQHLARRPQELVTQTFQSRRAQASPIARRNPAALAQRGRRLSTPDNPMQHTPLAPMIIRLDWFGCEPTGAKEQRIHQALETLQSVKPISRASVRVEEQASQSPPYHLTLMLTMPGPDVLAHGTGHTFEEALIKLEATALKTLEDRANKARQINGTIRGVKTLHRG